MLVISTTGTMQSDGTVRPFGKVEERMTSSTRTKIYFIENTETKRIKVGFTTSSVALRLAQLQTGSDSELRLLGVVVSNESRGLTEGRLHLEFAEWHYRGEWFTAEILPLVLELLRPAKSPQDPQGPVLG